MARERISTVLSIKISTAFWVTSQLVIFYAETPVVLKPSVKQFLFEKKKKQKTPQQNKENTKTPANRIEEIQLTLDKANYLDYNALAWEMVSPWKP